MKTTVHLIRVLVGLLFIFSGLIKANDPLGLSYKMQEFFDLWELTFLDRFSLLFSILIIAFEIIAGYALLIGWRMRTFIWLLLLLILFFTFLTGYAYFSARFRNCGCFGDCIPISSRTSFIKDLVLTALILVLFANRNHIRPLFGKKLTAVLMVLVVVFSFGIQWYTLSYLPVLDCLPFKTGNNIAREMQKPANAIDPVTEVLFVYEKNGQEIEFNASSFPADFNDSVYHFRKRYDKIIREGVNFEPPIKSFVLTGADGEIDSASFVLEQAVSILIIGDNLGETLPEWSVALSRLRQAASQRGVPIYFITSMRETTIQLLSAAGFTGIPVFSCDNVTIRTAARTNPCFYLLKSGTIQAKYSYKNSDAFLERVEKLGQKQVSFANYSALP